VTSIQSCWTTAGTRQRSRIMEFWIREVWPVLYNFLLSIFICFMKAQRVYSILYFNLQFHKMKAHPNYHHSQLYHHNAMIEGYKFLKTDTGTASLYHTDQVPMTLKQTCSNKPLMVSTIIIIHSFYNNVMWYVFWWFYVKKYKDFNFYARTI
jgi:hypothetical protein